MTTIKVVACGAGHCRAGGSDGAQAARPLTDRHVIGGLTPRDRFPGAMRLTASPDTAVIPAQRLRRCREEVLALLQGEPRRMATRTVLAAIL